MTSGKKLAKYALEHPELFTTAELVYFRRMLEFREARKRLEKAQLKLEKDEHDSHT